MPRKRTSENGLFFPGCVYLDRNEFMSGSIGNFLDCVDLTFADEASKQEFATFKRQYPWATYTEWWNYLAHLKSGGALPNPMNTQDWANRRTAYGVINPPANPPKPASPSETKPATPTYPSTPPISPPTVR